MVKFFTSADISTLETAINDFLTAGGFAADSVSIQITGGVYLAMITYA